MSDLITVQGVVISAMPDWRIRQTDCSADQRAGKDFGFCQRGKTTEQSVSGSSQIPSCLAPLLCYEGQKQL